MIKMGGKEAEVFRVLSVIPTGWLSYFCGFIVFLFNGGIRNNTCMIELVFWVHREFVSHTVTCLEYLARNAVY